MDPGRLYRNAFHPADIHNRETVSGSKFSQHAVNMIADSIFGELKLGGNLLIGHSPRDESDQLLFAIG